MKIKTIKTNGLFLGYCCDMLSYFIKSNGLIEDEFDFAFNRIENLAANIQIKKEIKYMIDDCHEIRRESSEFMKNFTIESARKSLETDAVAGKQRKILQVWVTEDEYRQRGLHRYLSSALLNEKPLLLFDLR